MKIVGIENKLKIKLSFNEWKKIGEQANWFDNSLFEHKGWKYYIEKDKEQDNIKMWYILRKDGDEKIFDWSPYNQPSYGEVKKWIDMGMPKNRKSSKWNPNDLEKAYEEFLSINIESKICETMYKIATIEDKLTVEAAEYKGKKVDLNKPFRTPGGPKKFSVYVKNDKGNVVKVNFGDSNMEIKRDDPERRKSFRARHNCDNPGPKWKARYWSCKFWSSKSVTDLLKG
jgi:hypothetical protein